MNIRFSGFGGQGVILSAVIMGWAAVLDGKNAIQTQSYGSSARGGACKSDVIIDDKYINELEPEGVDVLVSFSQQAFDKFSASLKDDGTLFYDNDLVLSAKHSADTFSIPATDIAHKEINHKIMANIVMMGFVNEKLKLLNPESIEKSIGHYVPEKFLEDNLKAFRSGMKLARSEN